MVSSSRSSTPSSSRLVSRLQWISLFFAWTVFIVSVATSLGSTSLWITMSAAVLTWALEGPLLWRDKRNAENNTPPPSLHPVPFLTEARNRMVAASRIPIPAPSPLSLACHLPFLFLRILITAAWVGGVTIGALLMANQPRVVTIGKIIDLVFSTAEIGIMIAVTVLCFRERSRRLRSKIEDGAWYTNGQYQ